MSAATKFCHDLGWTDSKWRWSAAASLTDIQLILRGSDQCKEPADDESLAEYGVSDILECTICAHALSCRCGRASPGSS